MKQLINGKEWEYETPTLLKSIIVFSAPATYYSDWELDAVVGNFFETDKGMWVEKHAISIEKHLTASPLGVTIISVKAIFPEHLYNFFILKWH